MPIVVVELHFQSGNICVEICVDKNRKKNKFWISIFFVLNLNVFIDNKFKVRSSIKSMAKQIVFIMSEILRFSPALIHIFSAAKLLFVFFHQNTLDGCFFAQNCHHICNAWSFFDTSQHCTQRGHKFRKFQIILF